MSTPLARALDALADQESGLVDVSSVSRVPALTVALDSLELLRPKPEAISILIAVTGTPQQLREDGAPRIRGAVFFGGPHLDDATANVAALFLGGPEIAKAGMGAPLGAGGILSVGPTRLSDWYVRGTAGDVLRVLVLL